MATTRTANSVAYVYAHVPTAIFRGAILFPIDYYAKHGKDHYSVITNHTLLHNGTYSTAIELGEEITTKWGSIAFWWNLSVLIPALYALPPVNLPFVAFDIVVTFYLSKATHYQTISVPHNKAACNPKNNANFAHLQRPPGTNESFFQAAARLNRTVTTPQHMCETFVEEWQYGVAMSFFYALISTLGIFAFLSHLYKVKHQGKSLHAVTLETGKDLLKVLLYSPKFVFFLLVGILWYIPESIFRCLPLSVKAPVRSGRRKALKARLGVEQSTEMKMNKLRTELKKRRNPRIRYQGGQGEKSPLSEFLGIYDIFVLIIEDLHYLDVINLSRVSKSVRDAVMPFEDFAQRMYVIECYSCRSTSKFRCWTCSNTTCSDCAQKPLIPQTTLLHHFDFCQPYCATCYNTYIVRKRPTNAQRIKSPRCTCAPVYAKPNLLRRYLFGSAYYQRMQASLPKFERQVCRECNVRTHKELIAMREKQIKTALKQGLQNSGDKWTHCARLGCGQMLGSGPRWWVCKNDTCRKECRSTIHQAWSSSDGKCEDENVAGDNSV